LRVLPERRVTISTIKILVADDHLMRRQSLVFMLRSRADFDVIGECTNGNELMRLPGDITPDVVLIDISLPTYNNLDPVTLIHQRNPDAPVLILSDSLSPQVAIRSLRSGALGVIVRFEDFDRLTNAIHVVANGHRYMSPQLSDQILDSIIAGRSFEPDVDDRISTREREILNLLAEGKTNAEIGKLLVISTRTVETHRKNLMGKLGLNSQGEMLRYAIKHGLLSTEE
jgi:two-component system, NarL family, response regulator NreC